MRLIDANKLTSKLCDECQHCFRVVEAGGEPSPCKMIVLISGIPTIEAEPVRHGQWIEDDYGFCRCSLCGWEWYEPEIVERFCPNCGAKMED